MNILWHYAMGQMPDFLNKRDGVVGWVRWSHRGVHRMDHILFPKSQERYIRSAKWEVKMNHRFEEVVRKCAANHAPTWIIEPFIEGLLLLHRMGFAHSWEAWQGSELVAGMFGIQMGGWVTLCSMYNSVRDASKAVVGRTLLQLKDRGFEFIDRGMVPNHSVDYGAQWMPRWEYESTIPRLLRQRLTLTDKPAPTMPWSILRLTPLARFSRKVRERILGEPTDPPNPLVEKPNMSPQQTASASVTTTADQSEPAATRADEPRLDTPSPPSPPHESNPTAA